MVLVQTVDGQVHKFRSWNTFHPGSEIRCIILSDGEDITRKIGGYDYYYIRKDAVASFSGDIALGGVYAVVVYGIFDTTRAEEELLQRYNESIVEIAKTNKDVENRLRRCKENYEVLRQRLKSKSICKVSMVMNSESCGLCKEKIDSRWYKKGELSNATAEKLLGKKYAKYLRV